MTTWRGFTRLLAAQTPGRWCGRPGAVDGDPPLLIEVTAETNPQVVARDEPRRHEDLSMERVGRATVGATTDTARVKPPYSSELEGLNATYTRALVADIDQLRGAILDVGRGPAVFVGSGGSMVLAHLAERLHEHVCRQPARACTSLELLDLPQLERRGAILFSSSAKHPDAHEVLAAFRRGRFSPTALVTHRSRVDVQQLASPDTRVVTLEDLAQPDGFLATGSIIQIATQLFRAYMEDPQLPRAIDVEAETDEADLRNEVLVLTPPSLTCVAADIEIRLMESGVACVQVADLRNFAHGRHTGYSRRIEDTTVIVLSDARSQALAEGTVAAMPEVADLRRWRCDSSWETTVISLLARSMRFIDKVGRRLNVDVARPAVPAFGRRLYRLPLRRRISQPLVGGVERKLLAGGAGHDAAGRTFYREAASAWLNEFGKRRFAGLVLDYDGTVCWTRRRWELPDEHVRRALEILLRQGLVLGVASGRGRSLHADLRRWVPVQHWAQVVVGLYNGGVQLRLDEDLPRLREPTAWSRAVTSAVGDAPAAWRLKVDERGVQVSVSVATGVLHHGQLATLLQARLAEAGVEAQVVASGHSVDILEPVSSKTSVADAVERRAGGVVLAIGDQGQLGGNDHALLASTSSSLSVDRCSADPLTCWFIGSGEYVGPDLLRRYIKSLRKRRGGFAMTGAEIS